MERNTYLLRKAIGARDACEERVRVALGKDGQVVEEHEILARRTRNKF